MNTLYWQLAKPLFFGGGPQVVGGMTAKETQDIQDRQNEFQQKAEIDRAAANAKAEKDRIAGEQAAIDLAKQQEKDRLASQNEAETMLADEATATTNAAIAKTSGKLSSSFYDSLYTGVTNDNIRPA